MGVDAATATFAASTPLDVANGKTLFLPELLTTSRRCHCLIEQRLEDFVALVFDQH